MQRQHDRQFAGESVEGVEDRAEPRRIVGIFRAVDGREHIALRRQSQLVEDPALRFSLV
ncbi:hypothetical protein D3C83_293820 [compost metagenome]